MKIEFTKMHGLGNDFIVIDLRSKRIREIEKVIRKLSHRRLAIGFDQALILKKSKKADFKMDIYNADGARVEMCGNGIRCLAKYIWDRNLSKQTVLNIETLAGIIKTEREGGLIKVDMGEPVLEASRIPTTLKGPVIDLPIKVGKKKYNITALSMGNPHAVIFVKDVDTFPVEAVGRAVETSALFPERTNVEFVQVINSKRLKMRVWERGAGETMACGTGACASAMAAHLSGLVKRSVRVDLPGGRLDIYLNKNNRVYMTGPTAEVFTGVVDTNKI